MGSFYDEIGVAAPLPPLVDDLISHPRFSNAPPEERQEIVDKWALQSAPFVRSKEDQVKLNGLIDRFRAAASETSVSEDIESATETLKGIGSSAAASFVGAPSAIMRVAVSGIRGAFGDADENAKRLASTAKLNVNNAKNSLSENLTPEGIANASILDDKLENLREDILNGRLPESPDELAFSLKNHDRIIRDAMISLKGDDEFFIEAEYDEDGFMTNERPPLDLDQLDYRELADFQDDPDVSRSLTGSEENMRLLSQFKLTRNPKYFDQLKSNLIRSPREIINRRDSQRGKVNDLGDVLTRSLTFGDFEEQVSESSKALSSSPLDLAMTAFSAGLGLLGKNATQSIVKAGLAEGAQGGIQTILDDSNSSLKEVAFGAFSEALGGASIAGGARVANRVVDKVLDSAVADPDIRDEGVELEPESISEEEATPIAEVVDEDQIPEAIPIAEVADEAPFIKRSQVVLPDGSVVLKSEAIPRPRRVTEARAEELTPVLRTEPTVIKQAAEIKPEAEVEKLASEIQRPSNPVAVIKPEEPSKVTPEINEDEILNQITIDEGGLPDASIDEDAFNAALDREEELLDEFDEDYDGFDLDDDYNSIDYEENLGRTPRQFEGLGAIAGNSRSERAVAKVADIFSSRGKFRNRPDVFNSKVLSEQLQASIRSRAHQNSAKLDSAVKKVLKRSGIGVIKRNFSDRGITARDSIMNLANKALVGDIPISKLPTELRIPVSEMRNHIDDVSVELITSGAVQGDLVQVIADNMGTYVNRSYRIFDFNNMDDARSYLDSLDPGIVNRAISFYRKTMERRPGETREQFESRSSAKMKSDLFSKVGSPLDSLTRQAVTIRDNSMLRRRKDVPEELRALWGERTTADENYVKTLFGMSSLLSSSKFLQDVENIGLREGFLSKEPSGENTVRFSERNGDPRFEPIGKYYTDPEFVEAINDTFTAQNLGSLMKVLMGINGAAKYAKTVLNPVTHVRNMVGNVPIVVANGNFSFFGDATSDAFKTSVIPLLPQKFQEVLEGNGVDIKGVEAEVNRYIELGVIGDSVQARELADVLSDARFASLGEGDFFEIRAVKAVKKLADKTTDLASGAYTAEDAFFKVLSFEQEYKTYAEAFPGEPQAQIEARAAEIVRNTMPTYTLVPEVVQKFRRVPFIASFVSFTSEMVRNQYERTKLTKEELTSGNAVLKKQGAKRLAGQLLAAATPTVLSAGFRAMAGLTLQDEEDMRSNAAPWDKDGQLVPWKLEDGRVFYINLSYTDPFSVFKDPARIMMGLSTAETAEERIVESIKEAFSPFTSEEIGMGALLDLRSNKRSDTGGSVWNDQDEFRDKFQKGAAYFWGKALEPGGISSARRIWKGVKGEQSGIGRDYNPAIDAAAVVSGMRITPLDLETKLSFDISGNGDGFRDAWSSATFIFNGVAHRRGTVSDDEIESSWRRMQNSRLRVFDKVVNDVSSKIRLGLPIEKARDIMSAAKAGKEMTERILSGELPEYEFSPAIIKRIDSIEGRREQLERVLGVDIPSK